MTESIYFDKIEKDNFYGISSSDIFTKTRYQQNNKGKQLEIVREDMDISERFFKIPESPFLIKVKGDSMIGCGIDSGDTLLVDRTKEPAHGDIVIAAINNRLVVKRLNYSYKEIMLLPENDNYMPIRIRNGDRLNIWGVATMVIKDMSRKG